MRLDTSQGRINNIPVEIFISSAAHTGQFLDRHFLVYMVSFASALTLRQLGNFRAGVCRSQLHALRRRSRHSRMIRNGLITLLIATSQKSGSSIRNQTNASRHDSRQELNAAILHARLRADAGNPRPYRDLIELPLSGNSMMFSSATTAVFI